MCGIALRVKFYERKLQSDRPDCSENQMQTRVAVIAIIVEKDSAVEKLNAVLHEYGNFIIGRMGIPYRARGVNIISVALDAPQDSISALSGKLGNIDGISVKTAYSSILSENYKSGCRKCGNPFL